MKNWTVEAKIQQSQLDPLFSFERYLKVSSCWHLQFALCSAALSLLTDFFILSFFSLVKLTQILFFSTPGPASVFIGSDPEGKQLYTGLLQDVRLYHSTLNRSQIHELHTQPSKTDLRNISGYLRYLQDERQKSFVVEVRNDEVEEAEEMFYLQLVAVSGGARLPIPRPTALLRVMKSDNANGLFGFTGACIPDVSGILEMLKRKPIFIHF